MLSRPDYHANLPNTGFKRMSLPDQLDVAALYLVDMNARNRAERKVMPPGHAGPLRSIEWRVCLPSARRPQWLSYYNAELALRDIKAEFDYADFDYADKVKSFYREALVGLPVERPTLLMVSEQNVGRFWPVLNSAAVDSIGDALDDVIPANCSWRIARIRLSDDGTVPLISPLRGFGRFAGLYYQPTFQGVFYSIQDRPLSAKGRNGVRQINRWRNLGYNPSTIEIAMIRLLAGDVPEEWAYVVHRLRQESSHTDVATRLPQPLHSVWKMKEYVMRLVDDE